MKIFSNIKKHTSELKKKLWFRIFIRIGAIFLAFVLLLTVCNTAFLTGYYKVSKEKELKGASHKIKNLDISDTAAVLEVIGDIQDKYSFDVEIYNSSGKTLFSSSGGQMMDFLFSDNDKLHMNHNPLRAEQSKTYSDGSVMETSVDKRTGNKYLVYRFSLKNSAITGEIRTNYSVIKNSADIANKFITIIAVAMLFVSLIWIFIFSRKISRPISKMSVITGKMAELDFHEKLSIDSEDEIGQLAESINDLSGKLDSTLKELKASNAQLRDEIELERSLDAMRKGFVANVSHELKTPISIIRGYAEGLKVGINSDNREKYCDTIIDESQRMNKLVLSLLNLSKYESGQVISVKTDFEITSLIKTVTGRIFEGSNADIVFDMPEKVMVNADADLIEQIIKSYVENARAHIDDKGTLRVSLNENDNNEYVISVFNTGSHIDEEIMPQIWQSFFRGDKSHNRQSGRFGLGLSIVSAIVKIHNKSCGVYNTENGVCFWFSVDKAHSNENTEK